MIKGRARKDTKGALSPLTVEKMVIYRRVLEKLGFLGINSISSDQLSRQAGCTAEVVRRDLRQIDYMGTSGRGYNVKQLLASLSRFLSPKHSQAVAVVGAGALGSAIIGYMALNRTPIELGAVFDADPAKVNQQIRGHLCLSMNHLDAVIAEQGIKMAILTVTPPSAKDVATQLVKAGITGILNCTSIKLDFGPEIQVVDIDIMVGLEKLAYFVYTHEKS